MNGTDDNVRVILEKPIPVLILYSTVVVDEKNHVFFFEDVYSYDKQLEEARKRGTHIRQHELICISAGVIKPGIGIGAAIPMNNLSWAHKR